MNNRNERPPTQGGRNLSRIDTAAGPKSPQVASALNKVLPAITSTTIGKIRQIGDSIPKLSDHADKLGITLKQYDSPILGIHGTIRGRATSAINRRQLIGRHSTDLIAKFDDAVNNPEASFTRKISQDLQQMNSASRKAMSKGQMSLTHSFLLGDKEAIEEEMSKLHDMVTSQTESSLGYGFELGESKTKAKAIKSGRPHINVKNKNAGSESQRSLRAMNVKIDKKVMQWMKSNPGLETVAVTTTKLPRNQKQLVQTLTTTSPPTSDDVKSERKYAVNEKLMEISNQFRKSLSQATSRARELIKTPDEDYVKDLAKTTQDSLAKMSITEGDIDAAFLKAIKKENNSAGYGLLQQRKNASLSNSKTLFKPLHTDLPTQKKLHNYVARRKEPFAPRPPRKDFENDYVSPVELFKDADYTDSMELRKRRSLYDASEPQIFQRTIDSGPPNIHRKIVDPKYRPGQSVTQWDPLSIKDAKRTQRALISGSEQEKGNQKPQPLKVTAETHGKMTKELAKKYYPNSIRQPLNEDIINQKLERSVQNIEDATKVATALGTLMSKVALTNNSQFPLTTELTGRLHPHAIGSQSLRQLQSPEEKRKGDNSVTNLAAELRQMADNSDRAYHAEMNRVQQRYTNSDEMKTQNKILKYTPKNNLTLLPGVSFTDQMLLKKLKSMEHFPK